MLNPCQVLQKKYFSLFLFSFSFAFGKNKHIQNHTQFTYLIKGTVLERML